MAEYIEREAAIEAMYKDAEAHPGHIFWTTQNEALRSIVRMSCNRGSTKGYKYTFRDMREES